MPVSWTERLVPPGQPREPWPLRLLRNAHWLAWLGLWWLDVETLPLAVVTLLVLAIERPFCFRLTEGVDIYLPFFWTNAAAAYVLGPVALPVYWLGSALGFALLVFLDGAGIVPATGLAAVTARRLRGEQYPLESARAGDWRHSIAFALGAVRVATFAFAGWLGLPWLAGVLLGELSTLAVDGLAPIPDRLSLRGRSARLAAALGHDMPLITLLLHVIMVCFLVLAGRGAGTLGFAAASLSTIVLHVIFKRLNDTRLESERRREELLAMRDELDRRQRLATIGRTASMVLHQMGRHHGAMGMYAHLLARGPGPDVDPAAWARTAQEHGARIATSVEEARRVIDELLRFAQDRALNLYPQSLAELLEECVHDCYPRAATRHVAIVLDGGDDVVLPVDKHKLKHAIGNLVDNAVEASPGGGQVEITASVAGGALEVTVRDHGAGVAEAVQDRLFSPFCTTKPHGIGLGLALAKEVVEAHGGTLTWRAAQPGTAFAVRLPVDAPAAGSVRPSAA